MKDQFVRMGWAAAKGLASVCCFAAAVSAALPAAAFSPNPPGNPKALVDYTRDPVSVTTANGHTIIDFGREAAGWVEINASAAGDYEFIVSEQLNPDGTAFVNSKYVGSPWWCYNFAPKGATIKSKDGVTDVSCSTIRHLTFTETRSDTGWISFKPTMRMMGYSATSSWGVAPASIDAETVSPFRYVEIVKAPFPVTKSNIRRIERRYPYDLNESAFSSSNANLDRVYEFCKYSTAALTYPGKFVDGDRERKLYEGDMFVQNLCAYAIGSDCAFPRASIGAFNKNTHTWPHEWRMLFVGLARNDWMWTGDTTLISGRYAELQGLVDGFETPDKDGNCYARASDGLLDTQNDGTAGMAYKTIVDWPKTYRYDYDYDEATTFTRKVTTVPNAFFYKMNVWMSEIATALGKTSDATTYANRAAALKTAFNNAFFDSSKGYYKDAEGSEHYSVQASAAALWCGLVPEDKVAGVVSFLKGQGMKCSAYFSQYLLEALAKNGAADKAVELMAASGENSWIRMMDTYGATTTLEAWELKSASGKNDDVPDMTHGWTAAPVNVISRCILGVEPAAAGWAKATIAPRFGTLTQASGTVPTAKGGVEVEYANRQLTVTVPTGMAADITFAGQTKTVAANAATRTVTITEGGGSGGGSGEVCASASWVRTAVKTADFVKSADNLFADERVKIAISNNKDGDRYMSSSDIAATGGYLQIPITQIFGTGYSVTFAGAAGLVDGLVGTTASSKDYSQYFLNRDPYPNAEGLYPCNVQDWSACLFSDGAVCQFDLPEAARLTGLKVYGYWKDNGRNRPSVAAVEVRQRGSDAWVALPGAAITVTQATTSMNCITLSAAEGFLATDVTAVRLTFGTHNNADCHGYTEIEATGEYTGVTSGGQVANAWTAEPSVTASFEEGTTPSMSLGTPAQGTPTANYTAAELAKLKPGDYTLDVRVAASDAATALRKTIGFTVLNREVSPEAATGMYLWTERTGKFDDATKWSGVYNGTKPHLATDSVKIVNTKNQYVTIDLEGKTLTAGKLLYNAAQRGSTLMNGTLNVENVEQTCKANLTFRDITLVGTGTIRSLMNFTCPTFVGNCKLQGIAVRCEKGSSGAVVRDGTLTFDRDFSYSKNPGFTDILTVDNARLIGTAIAPLSEKHKITLTLGENNADGQPMIKLSGAFNIISGSTLTVNAHALPAGTYTLVEAASVTDSGNVTGAATVSCDKGMTATLARTATAITLTLAGEREQQIAWSDWSGKKVAFLGDSYTTYADVAGVENPEFPKTGSDVDAQSKTWWQQVLTATGATLTKNLSMGGSPMTTCYTGKKNFYARVSASKNILSSPDAIFVFGGMNDFWMSGNFHDDPGRFADGLQTLFDYLDANYAAAAKYVVVNKLHVKTSWQQWGLTAEMREELTSSALRHGYEVIDLDGYFALEQADVDTASYPHPTAKGMTQIADRVLQVLRGEGGDVHVHVLDWRVETPATCEADGLRVATCSAEGCPSPAGTVIKTETITKLGHDFRDDWADDPDDETKEIRHCHREGCTATESRSKSAPEPEPIPVALPVAVTGLKYNGQTQTGVPAGTGYTITGNTAKDPGNYEATVTLEDGYVWSDGNPSKTRTVAWSIASQGEEPVPGDELLADGGFEWYVDKFTGGHNWLNGMNGAWQAWSKNAWNCPYGVWATRKGQSYWTNGEGMNGSVCCVLQVQNQAVWLKQTVTGLAAGTYRVTFLYQRRGGNTAMQHFTVSLVGASETVAVGSEVTVADDALHTFSGDVTLTSGDWTLRVDSPAETEDVSTLFDDFSLKAVGGDTPTHEHVLGPWTLETAPTCTEDGVSNRVCTASGCTSPVYEETAVAPKLGHDFRDDWADDPDDATKEIRHCHREGCTATESQSKSAPPEPVGDAWGYSNKVTVAGTDYMVVVFTNTAETIAWSLPSEVTAIDYLVVGGGGAGGTSGNAYGAGGGGAGGVVEDSCAVSSGAALAVTVGAGGEPGEANTNGGNGKGSSLSVGGTLVASALPGAGGAKGASGGPGGATDYACGGGAGGGYTSAGTKAGGAGSVSCGGSAYGQVGAGGGGAGGDGQNSGMEDGGVGCGGVGVSTTIFDGLEQRIAGGGAGSPSGRTLNPSVDGGGAGGQVDAYGNHPATAGSTWGAGGGGAKVNAIGGAGYQGVVVIRYAVGDTPEPEPVTVEPGVPVVFDTAEEATNAMKTARLTPSEEVAKMFGEDMAAKAAYCAMFEFDVVPSADGRWTVAAFLKPSDWTNVVESAQSATRQLPLADIAALELGETGEAVVEDCVPGFYYSLYQGSDVMKLKTSMQNNVNVLCGPDTKVTFPEVAKPSLTKGFFSVGVLEAPFIIPGEDHVITGLHFEIPKPRRR